MFETLSTHTALVGRVADALTRQDLTPKQFHASLRNHYRESILKRDGWFVFADLRPSPPNYEIELGGAEFVERRLNVAWPGPGSLVVDPGGEDELQVIATAINGADVSFAPVEFLPKIPSGSPVVGEGGFTSTLAEDLEGAGVAQATLASAAGLGAGEVMRIRRSSRLLLRPGPTYPFPAGSTRLTVRTVENTLGQPPILGAQVRITAVNSAALAAVLVGGVSLFRATLPAVPPAPAAPFLLGADAARTVLTNDRGAAVFFYPGSTPVTSLTVAVSKTGFVTQTRVAAITPGDAAFELVALNRS